MCDVWNKTDYTRGNHARHTGPSPDVGVILAGRRRRRYSIKSALGELNVSRLLENSHVLNMSRKTDRRPPTSNIRDVEPVLFWCWDSVADVGRISKQHRIMVSYLLSGWNFSGCHFWNMRQYFTYLSLGKSEFTWKTLSSRLGYSNSPTYWISIQKLTSWN